MEHERQKSDINNMNNNLITSFSTENPTQEDYSPENQESQSEKSKKMKKCPFCAELIQPEAIKCRYCGEFLSGFSRRDVKSPSRKWYYTTSGLIILLFITGPLAFFILPLVWLNPHSKTSYKIVMTVLISLFSILCIYLSIYAIRTTIEQFHQIEALGL